MKRNFWVIIGTVGLVAASAVVMGDNDEHEGFSLTRLWNEARLDVEPIANTLYRSECGSCHFAFQPGLLPANAWEAIMKRLDDHYGENAELDAATAAEITHYLTTHAADRSNYKRSKGFASSIDIQSALPRITTTRYFQRKHDEIPSWVLRQDNRSLRFAQCDACHTEADKGSFDEHAVLIPGFGRWED